MDTVEECPFKGLNGLCLEVLELCHLGGTVGVGGGAVNSVLVRIRNGWSKFVLGKYISFFKQQRCTLRSKR